MMILPDRRISRARFLIPVPKREWMPSSQAIPLDDLGNKVIRTRFRLRARAHDGHVVWCGWFHDREDADAFLFALACDSLRIERNLWRLPTPAWHPDLGEGLVYDFVTQTALTTTGSNQTYTSPSDWDNSANSIEAIGGGATGGIGGAGGHYTGGGGGAYSKITDFSFASPGTTTATYRIGASVTGATTTTSSATSAGTNGNPTWWNDTTNPGVGTDNTKCSAAGGSAGAAGTASRNGGAGGATTASWGQTKFAGGRGGNLTGGSGTGGSGGGGAAGPGGAGGNGGDSTSTSTVATDGGQGGNGSGGAAGTSGSGGTAGGDGTDLDGVNGSGGGGGGRSTGGTVGWAGGNYGGGSGGNRNTPSTAGDGIQGIILVTYTPLAANPVFATNLAMMGL